MCANLSTALFYFLLFSLMRGTLCRQVCATRVEQVSASGKTVELFTKQQIKGAKGPDGIANAENVNVKNFYSPALVSTNDFFVAFAGVNRIDGAGKKYINIATRYVENDKLLENKDDLNPEGEWGSRFAVQHEIEEMENAEKVVKGLLAVARNDEIYLLSVICTKPAKGDPLNFNFALYFVDDTADNGEHEKSGWDKRELSAGDVTNKLKEEFKDLPINDFSFSGLSFLVKEKIVFALMAKNSEKKMSALMQLNNEQKAPELEKTKVFNNCFSYFFPWREKIMMVPVDCDTKNKIMELSDIEGEWSDSKEAFSSHYKFLKNKQTFVTIKNDTTEILLFAEHKPQTAGQSTKKINLWMSDGTRLKNIGEIVDGDEKITPVSFLFAGGKLFSLNQQLENGKESESVKLTYLKQQSTEIISTINAWSTTDAEITKLCNKKQASKIPCTTNGLVGFLSNTEENNGNRHWKDEYLYKNAIVTPTGTEGKKAKKVQDGFTFSGVGAGAKWEVGKEDQPYNFANPGFTLVATVKIDGDANNNKKENSILGFNYIKNNNKLSFGLWCTKDGHWRVSEGEEGGELNKNTAGEKCDKNKIYEVALTLIDKTVLVYINGERIKDLTDKAITAQQPLSITHFYFGADNNAQKSTAVAESYVTVTNVLLYNRPFDDGEIRKVKKDSEESDLALPPLNKYSALRVHVGVLFFVFGVLSQC